MCGPGCAARRRACRTLDQAGQIAGREPSRAGAVARRARDCRGPEPCGGRAFRGVGRRWRRARDDFRAGGARACACRRATLRPGDGTSATRGAMITPRRVFRIAFGRLATLRSWSKMPKGRRASEGLTRKGPCRKHYWIEDRKIAATVAGYEAAAKDGLAGRFEAIRSEELLSPVIDLLPSTPCEVADIGAGTGRDAAWLVSQGNYPRGGQRSAAV